MDGPAEGCPKLPEESSLLESRSRREWSAQAIPRLSKGCQDTHAGLARMRRW